MHVMQTYPKWYLRLFKKNSYLKLCFIHKKFTAWHMTIFKSDIDQPEMYLVDFFCQNKVFFKLVVQTKTP